MSTMSSCGVVWHTRWANTHTMDLWPLGDFVAVIVGLSRQPIITEQKIGAKTGFDLPIILAMKQAIAAFFEHCPIGL